MGNCYIVAANLKEKIVINKDDCDLIIAADGGYSVIHSDTPPDIILGDFDSLGFVPKGKNVVCLPVEKDDTDTLAAVRIGIDKGFKNFFIYGGLGGRTDHTVANIQTLSFIAENGGRGYLVGENEVFTVIKNSFLQFKAEAKGTVSVFAYGAKAEGVNIKGLSYELSSAELNPSFPLGVSNSFKGEASSVSVEKGSLLVSFGSVMFLMP